MDFRWEMIAVILFAVLIARAFSVEHALMVMTLFIAWRVIGLHMELKGGEQKREKPTTHDAFRKPKR